MKMELFYDDNQNSVLLNIIFYYSLRYKDIVRHLVNTFKFKDIIGMDLITMPDYFVNVIGWEASVTTEGKTKIVVKLMVNRRYLFKKHTIEQDIIEFGMEIKSFIHSRLYTRARLFQNGKGGDKNGKDS